MFFYSFILCIQFYYRRVSFSFAFPGLLSGDFNYGEVYILKEIFPLMPIVAQIRYVKTKFRFYDMKESWMKFPMKAYESKMVQ